MSYPTAKIGELVKRPPVTLPPLATVEDAVKLMYRENIGSIIVTSPEGRVLGIFTEKDLVRVIGEGKPLSTKLGEVMTKDPITVREEDTIVKAVTILSEKRIRHLPIVDSEGRIKGVVSVRDIVSIYKRYLEQLEEVSE
ncbi:MAG: CBS domain-containing protein [Acidilobaceae archaeon]